MKRHMGAQLALALLVAISLPEATMSQQDVRGGEAGSGMSGDLRDLIAAERAFARLSVERGTRAAFLEYLAADALIFRPRPEPGRAHWEGRPEPTTVLSWEPAFACVAASGDLGYSTGPWALHDRAEGKRPPSHGQFVSIWRREPAGWRVVVDLGIVHTKPDSGAVTLSHPAPKPSPGEPDTLVAGKDLAALAHDIQAADEALATAITRSGLAALDTLATADIRVLRMGRLPGVGRKDASRLLAGKPGEVRFTPAAAAAARSADLGYSYGTAEYRGSDGLLREVMSYVHVWRRDPGESWRLALDIALTLPRDSSSQ